MGNTVGCVAGRRSRSPFARRRGSRTRQCLLPLLSEATAARAAGAVSGVHSGAKGNEPETLIGLLCLLGVFGVAVMVGELTSDSRRQATSPARAKPTTVLDVSAGKGITGLSVTNREAFAISDCQLTALERGRPDEFVATVKEVSP